MENLLTNAVEAMEGQGRLSVSTRLVGESVALTVEDSGPGMTEAFIREHREHGRLTSDAGEPASTVYVLRVACACGFVGQPLRTDGNVVRRIAEYIGSLRSGSAIT